MTFQQRFNRLKLCRYRNIEWSDEKYLQYIENFNSIDKTNTEILHLESAYEKIIVLNEQINNTDIHFDHDENCTDEYFKMTDELEELEPSIFLNINPSQLYREKEKELHDYQININKIYQKYFTNDKVYMESLDNIDIKIYKIKIFNLQKENELKKLLELVISYEVINHKLLHLYERKIQLITIDY
jgi:hypothetical protein